MLITKLEANAIAIASNKIQFLSDRIKEAAKRGEFTLDIDVVQLDAKMIQLLREAGYSIVGGKRQVGKGFGVSDDDEEYIDIYIIRWN